MSRPDKLKYPGPLGVFLSNYSKGKGPFECYVTQMGVGEGVSDFLGKSVMNGSMLLALRGGEWPQTPEIVPMI